MCPAGNRRRPLLLGPPQPGQKDAGGRALPHMRLVVRVVPSPALPRWQLDACSYLDGTVGFPESRRSVKPRPAAVVRRGSRQAAVLCPQPRARHQQTAAARETCDLSERSQRMSVEAVGVSSSQLPERLLSLRPI